MNSTVILSSRDRKTLRAWCAALGYRSISAFSRRTTPDSLIRGIPADLGARRPLGIVGAPLSAADVPPGASLWVIEMLDGVPHAVHVGGDAEALRELRNHRLRIAPEIAPLCHHQGFTPIDTMVHLR